MFSYRNHCFESLMISQITYECCICRRAYMLLIAGTKRVQVQKQQIHRSDSRTTVDLFTNMIRISQTRFLSTPGIRHRGTCNRQTTETRTSTCLIQVSHLLRTRRHKLNSNQTFLNYTHFRIINVEIKIPKLDRCRP